MWSRKRGGFLVAILSLGSVAPSHAAEPGYPERQFERRPFDPSQKTPLPQSWVIGGQTYNSPREYADLRDGCMELLRRYPPDRYFFVGLGRDPAPVIAFLQNLGGRDLAVNLPSTSNIGWNGRVPEADVARHIEAAIPWRILRGERQIVILDVTSTGKTPALFGPYFDQYLRAHGNNTPVVRLAFTWANRTVRRLRRGRGGRPIHRPDYASLLTDRIDTGAWPDFRNYPGGKYEGTWTPLAGGVGIAEHQRHVMGAGVQPPTQTNPNYAAFRASLWARMEQDEVLERFLVTGVISSGSSLATAPAPAPAVYHTATTHRHHTYHRHLRAHRTGIHHARHRHARR